MYKKMLLMLCVVLMSGTAMAADNIWVGGAQGDWLVYANWSNNALPAAGDTSYTSLVRSDFTDTGWDAYLNWRDNGQTVEQALAMGIANPSWAGWTNQTIETYAGYTLPALNSFQLGGEPTHSNGGKMCMGTLNLRTNLTVTSNFTLGGDDYCAGEVNQYFGNLTVGNQMRIGQRYRSVYNMYGGTVTINKRLLMPRSNSGWASTLDALSTLSYDDNNDGVAEEHYTTDNYQPIDWAKHQLNIYGGVMTLNNSNSSALVMSTGSYPNARIMIDENGKLRLKGDQSVNVAGYISSGQIYSPSGTPEYAYYTSGADNGYTVIVPEPATMLMLGLGAFGLIRRRK